MSSIAAVYFDGESARDRAVTLRREGDVLAFEGPDTPLTRWSIAGLHAIDPPAPGQPFRLTHDEQRGCRLVLRDEGFVADLVASNTALKGGYSWKHLGHVLGWTAGGLAVAAALGWMVMSFLPQQVAHLLPESWRNRVGDQVVASLVGSARQCDSAGGREAISALVAALAEGSPDLPPVSIRVYNIPITNAFAAPGGKIVFTHELLRKADGPDEVAGVLAHEIGHVSHRHPEAQMVRLAGMQVLLSTLTGGSSSGEWTGNIAALAALFRYSREAETEADAYAREVMTAASVDPTGLRRFFEKIMKIEGTGTTKSEAKAGTPSSTLDKIGNVFSTHPGTAERIKDIQPLPPGKKPVVIMPDAQWKALKAICG